MSEQTTDLSTVKCPYCRKMNSQSDFINPSNPNKIYKSCSRCRTSALEFYQSNRKRILERSKLQEEKCECGCPFNSITRHVHLRSKVHILFIKNKLQLQTNEEAKDVIKQTNDQRKIDKKAIPKIVKPPKPQKSLEFHCEICNVKVKGCSRKAHLSTKMHSRSLMYTEEKERILKQLGSPSPSCKRFSTDMLELMQRGDDERSESDD